MGVIVNSDFLAVTASLFVPALSLALLRVDLGLPVGANCIYVEPIGDEEVQVLAERLSLATSNLGASITLLVDAPSSSLRNLALFALLLERIEALLVVIVPAVEDMAFWATVRDMPWENCLLALRLGELLSPEFIARYKTLHYEALVVDKTDNVRELLLKRRHPDVLVHQKDALKHLLEELKQLISEAKIVPHSDMLIDPLQPLTTHLDLRVYETFEQDSVKYAQYDAAIEMAVDDLRLRGHSLRILVIGPGRGPLLEFVMHHTQPTDKIVAIERNANCIDILKQKTENKPNVELIYGDVRLLVDPSQYDLVVSELLGSFGCNEACPEILSLFTKSSLIMIPLEYTSYVQPIYTDLMDKSIMRPYLAHLNSYFPVGDLIPIFLFAHPGNNLLSQEIKFSFRCDKFDFANALYGYFEANLYGPFRISILPEASSHERCLSWYPMVFPLRKVHSDTEITIRRRSEDKFLLYEWSYGDVTFNVGSSRYTVDL